MARGSGDRLRLASALIDLGASRLREGDARGAVPPLEEALAIVSELGDRPRRVDVLIELGTAALALGNARGAFGPLQEALAGAGESGNRFQIKLALDRIATAQANLGGPERALETLDRALALTRELGDRRHEALLLWNASIQHATLGQRDRALEAANSAVDLMESLGNPEAAWYADHLHRYRQAEAAAIPGPAAGDPWSGGVIVANAGAMPGASAGGPGLLQMARSATQAMAKFIGSGFRTVPDDTLRARLATCTPARTTPGCAAVSAAASREPRPDWSTSAARSARGRTDTGSFGGVALH